MKKFRRLRDKLMTVVLLTTFSALTVANGIFLLYDINTYRATRTNEMTTQIEMLGYATVAALQFEDAEVARENLALLEFRPSVRAAAIYDASGSLFATYGRADANHEFPALPGDAGVQSDMSTLTVFNRILAEGRILGTAYILAEFPLGERILSYVGILSIVALVAMLVSVLVCFWLQSLVTRPVLDIAHIAREVVTTREYSQRARKSSEDEVGELVDAFNDMLSVIEQSTVELEDSNLELAREIGERARAQDTIEQLNAQLETKVLERTQQLESANQELESFCYSVSHDLRGPLRSISGFSQALVEELPEQLPGDARRFLDKILAATTRMGQLIEDLLNLSRVSRGELVRQPVNLSDLAWQVIRELQASEPGYHVDVSVWEGINVEGDQKLLRIVLENLLGNAWKFTSKQQAPRVEVGLMKDGVRETCFIRDNGVGFDMRYADKLFGAFQRLHAMHEYPGTGIGLATVQRIIHRHGGRVWVDSAPDKGAVFYFTLRHDNQGFEKGAQSNEEVT